VIVKFVIKLARLFIVFIENAFGCLNHPYITFRKLAASKNIRQTVFIFLLVLSYFAFATLLRTGMRNPYLLTLKFNMLLFAGLIGFFGMIVFLYLFGRLLGSPTSFKTFFLLWSYTLLPTLVWFFVTSILYLIFPPPRTMSILGKLYSIIFISFSMALLIWKLILYYFALRFGARLDLWRIGFISIMLLPLIVIYSLSMYRLGIFRIPFL
jgi:hypothetical protein